MSTLPPQPESSPRANTPSKVDRATVITEDLIDRGAPWSTHRSWRIMLGEGIVAAILGLIFLLQPVGGASTTLQLIGLVLLIAALITAFQIWRHRIRPDRQVVAAFRAGSGVTVGLVVVVATFFTDVTAAVSASLAVVVGIGFIIFGAAGIAAGFIGRSTTELLPAAGLITNAVLVVAGGVLMFSGAGGSESVDSIFSLLGLLLIASGVVLSGYAYYLRQQEASGFGP